MSGYRVPAVCGPGDVSVCEACWREPVRVERRGPDGGRDLLCAACGEAGHPARVELFPPFGVRNLHPAPEDADSDTDTDGIGDGAPGAPGGSAPAATPAPRPPG
ncbi:hypothetical protein ACN20G_09620 [Streptomyces sp. BI20]|uniref:hypothetical protein n=1 Tax=Streptomyces sp. BI20 TaxID=3403460 RepID=UPI003C775E7F